MKNVNLTGSMLAIAAATLISSAAFAEEGATPPESSTATVHCMAVNECKGQGACATSNNACGGQNECKGQGYLELTAEDCEAKGGTAG
jgi:hypothetical protein